MADEEQMERKEEATECGSSRSVAPIKAEFVAQVGRRKAGT